LLKPEVNIIKLLSLLRLKLPNKLECLILASIYELNQSLALPKNIKLGLKKYATGFCSLCSISNEEKRLFNFDTSSQ
jgi:hypothetical protein